MSGKEAPPSYDVAAATSSTSSSRRAENGIPPPVRRSMEDLTRPLPSGWVRQWDPKSHHHFYVDTKATPPRSLWSHPLGDEQYRSEHPEEAKKLSSQPLDEHTETFRPDESSDEGSEVGASNRGQGQIYDRTAKPQPKGMKKLGRSMKDKMTGTSHAERVAKRQRQREAEQKAYEQHQAIQAAMVRASQTGQPQLVGKDRNGRDIYAQPPPPGNPYMGANVGYTPYQQDTNAYGYGGGAYGAPYGPYNRRGGYGYGGGMGMPLMGGMMGGMLLGGLLF